jgi:hypothetical protein
MIKGQSKTESNYRAIQTDSSSSLKDFSMDRKKYYRRYVLGEFIEEKENQAVNMGRLVETLLMEPEDFDNKFYMSSTASTPTGLMLDFVEALYKFTKEATDEFGVINKSFEEISNEAYVASGFKIKYEQVISKFIGSDAEIYYNEIRKVRSQNLTVVNSNDVNNAEKIVEELRNNFATKNIVNCENSKQYKVMNQFQVEDYTVLDHHFKSMIDKVIIDFDNETIDIYDLKCTWSVENFYNEYYLYRRSYIQAYLYWQAVKFVISDPLHICNGFTVNYPKFIVCDSTNYFNPLIYTLDSDDMEDALKGFTNNGKKYPGVEELISDLKWALEKNVWNISRKNYDNQGFVKIKK